MGVSEDSDPAEEQVVIAPVVPERELWLLANSQARELLLRGIAQAAAGQFVKEAPDLSRDATIIDQLPD